MIDVLLACAPSHKGDADAISSINWVQPATSSSNAVVQVVPVLLSLVTAINHLRIHLPKDLRPVSGRETAWKAVREIQRQWPKSVPLLDPVENMGIEDASFLNLVKVCAYLHPSSFTLKHFTLNRRCESWTNGLHNILWRIIHDSQNITRSMQGNKTHKHR